MKRSRIPWKWASSIVGTAILLAVAILIYRGTIPDSAALQPDARMRGRLPVHSKRKLEEVEKVLEPSGGADQVLAVDQAQQIANEHRQLPESARADLLLFIANGKPEDLLDTEWQERVNVIFNSLRDQPGGVNSSHPGLTHLLQEMAASDPDPILRMYAMQHLALFYPEIADADDKKQVLEVLTQILGLTGERSRGSALQALSDIALNGAAQEVQQV